MRPDRFRPARRERGIALLIVLWGLALITLLALTVSSEGRSNLLVTRNLIAVTKARAAAEAGIHHALYEMLAFGASSSFSASGEVYRYALGDTEYAVRILDETGRIDLNTLRPELLERMLEQLAPEADATALTAAFMDFRDRDTLPSPAGIEDDEYEALGYTHDAKDRNFEHVSELAQVPGFRPAIVEALTPFVTVYSRQRSVRAEAALPETLALVAGEFGESESMFEDGQSSPGEAAAAIEGFDRSRIYLIESIGIEDETRIRVAAHVILTGNTGDAFQFVSWDESPAPGGDFAEEISAKIAR